MLGVYTEEHLLRSVLRRSLWVAAPTAWQADWGEPAGQMPQVR